MTEQSVLAPDVHVWVLAKKKTREERTFYQSELTIDSEAALMGLASRVIGELAERGIPISSIGTLMSDAGEIDWPKVTGLLSQASPMIPQMASEVAAILCGYSPVNEEGRPAEDWTPTVAFMRGAISIPILVEMLQVFTEQNDYKRLSAPFATAVRSAIAYGLTVEKKPALEPSPS